MAQATGIDMDGYRERLTAVINSALDSYGQRHGRTKKVKKGNKTTEKFVPARSSVRKITEEIGEPTRHNTVYKWHRGSIRTPLQPSSYPLLAQLDPEERTALELQAHLEGRKATDIIFSGDAEELTLAVMSHAGSVARENEGLKKQLAQREKVTVTV